MKRGVENQRLGKKRLALIVLLASSSKELIDFAAMVDLK